MTQFDLFAEEQEVSVSEMEKTLSEMENFIAKFEKDERFFNAAKAFNWETEFSQLCNSENIFEGFDAVVGNPPYFSVTKLKSYFYEYFKQLEYKTYSKTSDVYCLFYELGSRILKENGILGFITSSQWQQTQYGTLLRKFFIENVNPILIFNLGGFQVFPKATVDTTILIFTKEKCKFQLAACLLKNDFDKKEFEEDYFLRQYFAEKSFLITDFSTEKWSFENNVQKNLRNKIKNSGIPLKNWNIEIFRGIITGFNEAFFIDESTKNELIAKDKNNKKIIKPILRGRDLDRFRYDFANLYLIFTHNGIKKENIPPINVEKDFPTVFEYLKKFENQLKIRKNQGVHWTNLQSCSFFKKFEKEKLIYPETTGNRGEFFVDTSGMFLDKTCFMIVGEHLHYFSAVLSSKLMTWYLNGVARLLGNQGIQYSKYYMVDIPILQISEKQEQEIEKIVKEIAKRKQKGKNTDELESQIDKLVYKLYDLTDSEVKIVEKSMKYY